MYKTVQPLRLYEQIVQQIKESILTGALKPGDQLPAEPELAHQFSVSRTAVREAVKVLREKGLVEAYSGRGTFITNGTSQAVSQSLDLMIKINQPENSGRLVEVREIFEPEIAALAATRSDERHLAALRKSIAVMDRALQDAEAFIEADMGFHLLLAKAAGNPLIMSLIDPIVGLLREQRMRIFRLNGGGERGQIHHRCILRAVEERDADKAREAMRAHLHQVRVDSRPPGSETSASFAKSVS